MTDQTKGKIELIVAMIISGSVGLFVILSGQSSHNSVFFRCLIGGACLIVFGLYRGYFDNLKLSFKQFILILLSGFAVIGNWILLFESYNYAAISISTVAYHSQPIFLLIFAAVFLNEKLNAQNVSLVILAFSGLILIADPFDQSLENLNQSLGILLALGAALLYAIATLIIKMLEGIKPYLIATIQVILGVLILAPFVDFNALPKSLEEWKWLFGLGLIHTCIMYILLYSAFQKLSTSTIAVLAYIYPAVAIILDYVVFNQNLNLVQILGIGLIVLSGLLKNIKLQVLFSELIQKPIFKFSRLWL